MGRGLSGSGWADRRMRRAARPAWPPRPALALAVRLILPKTFDWIRVKVMVIAYDRDAFDHGLSNQKPVERVTMVKRQIGQHGRMFRLNRQDDESVFIQANIDEIFIRPMQC